VTCSNSKEVVLSVL